MGFVNTCTPQRTLKPLPPGDVPERGAHLVTPWMGFLHHGIYVGEGKVVHYGALIYDLIRRPVEESPMADFAQGRPVFVVDHAEDMLPADEVVSRARSRLGENQYRLFSNNCEHFCEWCLHDTHRSFQVETALAYPRMLGEWFQDLLGRAAQRLFWVARPARARIAPPEDSAPTHGA